MSPLAAVSSVTAAPGLLRPEPLTPPGVRPPASGPAPTGTAGAPGGVFESMIREVEGRQAAAGALTREVLLGDSPNLHHSIIARQEAALSFSLLVEVRNKVVESYQELMRLPV